MCVIIVKPAGAKMPSIDELRMAHNTHPHGMGFVSPSVHYKGMSFGKFIKQLERVPRNEPCIIHFRFATHGSVCVENCHPFNHGNVWFAHNGILDITPVDDMTDSQTAFEHYIYPAIERYGIDSIRVNSICQYLVGRHSKFAMLQGNDIKLFGNYSLRNGCYYSNTRHLTSDYYYKTI